MPSSTCIPSTKVIVVSRGSLANDDMSNQDHERRGRMERLSLYAQQEQPGRPNGSKVDGLACSWAEDVLADGRGVMSSLPAWGLVQRM